MLVDVDGQPTVGGAIPRQVGLGSIRKAAEQTRENKPEGSIPPCFHFCSCLGSCPDLPAVMGYDFLLVMVLITLTENEPEEMSILSPTDYIVKFIIWSLNFYLYTTRSEVLKLLSVLAFSLPSILSVFVTYVTLIFGDIFMIIILLMR